MSILKKSRFQVLAFLILASGVVIAVVADQPNFALVFLAGLLLGIAALLVVGMVRIQKLRQQVKQLQRDLKVIPDTPAPDNSEALATTERRLLALLEVEREQNLRRHREIIQLLEKTTNR